MKKILLSVALFIFVIVGGLLFNLFLTNREPEETAEIKVGGAKFKIEIAKSSLEQARGLSGRESLAEDAGMLFIFNGNSIRSFWMAGMQFPLDIIWISGHRVVGISENLPPASAGNVQIYNSPEPVDRVLEINAGLADRLGIKPGDLVEY
jgi:uncharacterized protein